MPIGDPPDRLYADTLHVCIMREVGEGRPPPSPLAAGEGRKGFLRRRPLAAAAKTPSYSPFSPGRRPRATDR